MDSFHNLSITNAFLQQAVKVSKQTLRTTLPIQQTSFASNFPLIWVCLIKSDYACTLLNTIPINEYGLPFARKSIRIVQRKNGPMFACNANPEPRVQSQHLLKTGKATVCHPSEHSLLDMSSQRAMFARLMASRWGRFLRVPWKIWKNMHVVPRLQRDFTTGHGRSAYALV